MSGIQKFLQSLNRYLLFGQFNRLFCNLRDRDPRIPFYVRTQRVVPGTDPFRRHPARTDDHADDTADRGAIAVRVEPG